MMKKSKHVSDNVEGQHLFQRGTDEYILWVFHRDKPITESIGCGYEVEIVRWAIV